MILKISQSIFIALILSVILVISMSTPAFADVPSPKKQTNIGIDQEDIICKTNLVKVFRLNTESVSCFKPESAQKLIDSGFALEISKDILDSKKSIKQAPPIGTVKGIIAVDQYGAAVKLSSKLRVVEYLQFFEVCANDKTIRAPEILLTSDSESKTVKMAQPIPANQCYNNSAKIKATDPSSISVSLTNKGMISDKITELETTVSDLKEKLNTLKSTLPLMAKDPSTLDNNQKKKISDTTNEIGQLRTELNQAKGELNKYQFALFSPKQIKASDFTKQKLTLTGLPFQGASSNIITVTKQTIGTSIDLDVKQTLHNVVFEACSGKETIRAPEVIITSDIEEKTIKVSEKIIANSCQMSTGKINANDEKSITVSIVNKSDVSLKITDLEKSIQMKSEEQRTYQLQLNKLLVQSDKPLDYEQKIVKLGNKIIQLRDEIRDYKFQIYGTLYETYDNP